jgi:hypothetical protein
MRKMVHGRKESAKEEGVRVGGVLNVPWFIALSSSHAGNTVINRNVILGEFGRIR